MFLPQLEELRDAVQRAESAEDSLKALNMLGKAYKSVNSNI